MNEYAVELRLPDGDARLIVEIPGGNIEQLRSGERAILVLPDGSRFDAGAVEWVSTSGVPERGFTPEARAISITLTLRGNLELSAATALEFVQELERIERTRSARRFPVPPEPPLTYDDILPWYGTRGMQWSGRAGAGTPPPLRVREVYSLHYKVGASDKLYQLMIVRDEDSEGPNGTERQYRLIAAWGRRFGTTNLTDKGGRSLVLEQAEELLGKVLRQQLRDGYDAVQRCPLPPGFAWYGSATRSFAPTTSNSDMYGTDTSQLVTGAQLTEAAFREAEDREPPVDAQARALTIVATTEARKNTEPLVAPPAPPKASGMRRPRAW